jgi:hypothetical protein
LVAFLRSLKLCSREIGAGAAAFSLPSIFPRGVSQSGGGCRPRLSAPRLLLRLRRPDDGVVVVFVGEEDPSTKVASELAGDGDSDGDDTWDVSESDRGREANDAPVPARERAAAAASRSSMSRKEVWCSGSEWSTGSGLHT